MVEEEDGVIAISLFLMTSEQPGLAFYVWKGKLAQPHTNGNRVWNSCRDDYASGFEFQRELESRMLQEFLATSAEFFCQRRMRDG